MGKLYAKFNTILRVRYIDKMSESDRTYRHEIEQRRAEHQTHKLHKKRKSKSLMD